MKRIRLVVFALSVMVSGCTSSNEVATTPDAAVTAQKILKAARSCLGGEKAVNGFATIRAQAKVKGPGSEFVSTVWSGSDGRARMELTGGFAAGSHPSGNWRVDRASGTSVTLHDEELAFVRGHELHATVLAPQSRYDKPTFDGEAKFADQEALVVSMTDHLGKPVRAYFSVVDTLPLGFRMTQPEPDVVVTLGGWEWRQDLFVFTRATIAQGEEDFYYDYIDIQMNNVPDSVFVAPGIANR